MKYKLLKLITIGTMLLSTIFVVSAEDSLINENKAFQNEEEFVSSLNFLNTEEPEMPIIDSKYENYNRYTTRLSTRKQWIEEVTEILEAATEQRVIAVFEDNEHIVFKFEEPIIFIEDKILDEGSNEVTKPIVSQISYLKPEAKENILTSTTISPQALETRIVEINNWSGGYYEVGNKTGLISTLINAIITYTPNLTKTVGFILGEISSGLIAAINESQPITAKVYNKYYYKNKVGQVYQNGIWMSCVYVGSRFTWIKSWATYIKKGTGEPIAVDYVNNANSTNSNYNSAEYKAHYNDDAWIRNRAIQATDPSSGLYLDYYGGL